MSRCSNSVGYALELDATYFRCGTNLAQKLSSPPGNTVADAFLAIMSMCTRSRCIAPHSLRSGRSAREAKPGAALGWKGHRAALGARNGGHACLKGGCVGGEGGGLCLVEPGRPKDTVG
jgi:hypothetical protein